MLRWSSWMAVVVGGLLAVGQAVRNADHLAQWLNWGVDVAAGLVLVYGGWRALRRGSDRSLAAAWAFAAGLFVSAFGGHVQTMLLAQAGGPLYAAERRLVVIVGALLLVSAAGVAMSLLGRRR